VSNFEFHTHKIHYAWDYTFLIDYLKRKKRKAHDAITLQERNIIEIIEKENEDQKWFPCYFDYEKETQDKRGQAISGGAKEAVDTEKAKFRNFALKVRDHVR
jgi:hypothetical protein